MYQYFLCIGVARLVLSLVEHQVGFGLELQGQLVGGRGYAQVEIACGELLLAVGGSGQEVEVAQVEVSGQVHVHLAEGMAIVYGGMGAVGVRIPFTCAAGDVERAVHPIHAEGQVEAVFGG